MLEYLLNAKASDDTRKNVTKYLAKKPEIKHFYNLGMEKNMQSIWRQYMDEGDWTVALKSPNSTESRSKLQMMRYILIFRRNQVNI